MDKERKSKYGRPKLKQTKSRRIDIRLTEEEFSLLEKKRKSLSKSQFFAKLIRENEIKLIDPVTQETLNTIKRHGNNLNQIARKINTEKTTPLGIDILRSFEAMKKEIIHLYQEIKAQK